MIESVYAKYFQKSRSFLYPALGIKKSSYTTPTGTYLSIEGLTSPEDMKLACAFKDEQTEGFKAFEEQMLLSNPLYSSRIQLQEYNIYLFDFSIYQNDWFNFILGKYSKLSPVIKRAIKQYYGETSQEYEHMDSYLFPEKYFDVYAKILGVKPGLLKQVGELCDPCNMEKETLKIPVELLDLFKKVL